MKYSTFSKTNLIFLLCDVSSRIADMHGFSSEIGHAQVENKGILENIAYGKWSTVYSVLVQIRDSKGGFPTQGVRFSKTGLKEFLQNKIQVLVAKHGFDTANCSDSKNRTISTYSEEAARDYGAFDTHSRLIRMLGYNKMFYDDLFGPLYTFSYSATKVVEEFKELPKKVQVQMIEDIEGFKSLCESLSPSKKTHYDRLEDWANPVYSYIRTMLDKHGFKNGESVQLPAAKFWQMVYRMPSSIIHSPNLISEVSNHHSSADERNKALIIELWHVIYLMKKDLQ